MVNTTASFWKSVTYKLQEKCIVKKHTHGYFWWHGFKTLCLAIKTLQAKLITIFIKKKRKVFYYTKTSLRHIKCYANTSRKLNYTVKMLNTEYALKLIMY